jgi:ADP-ribose pyrophosphatase YjhB (NUDIX family)
MLSEKAFVTSSVTVALPKTLLRIGDEPYRVVGEIPQEIAAMRPVRVTARGIALHGDDMLCVRQGLTGMWAIPGGGTEPGETPDDAVAREMLEETGFAVTRATHAVSTWELYGDRLYVTLTFLCEGQQDGDVTLTDEERMADQQAAWIPIRDAIAEFSKGLPDEATGWSDHEGRLRRELGFLSRYLSHASDIYARDEAILRTLFPYG